MSILDAKKDIEPIINFELSEGIHTLPIMIDGKVKYLTEEEYQDKKEYYDNLFGIRR